LRLLPSSFEDSKNRKKIAFVVLPLVGLVLQGDALRLGDMAPA
jgi:hypothetical protein